MKKLLSILLVLSLFLSVLSVQAYAEDNQDIKVYVNDKQVIFDSQPFIEDGTTLVPMRAIFEALGATVEWYEKEQTVISRKNFDITVLYVGNKFAINGTTAHWKENIMLKAPKIINDRVYVPLRFISESLGMDVKWNEETSTIFMTPQIVEDKSAEEIAKLSEALVTIETYDKNNNKLGVGSGVIISYNGYILTNYHVIEGSDIVKITDYYGNSYTQPDLKLEYNIDLDIALFLIPSQNIKRIVELGNSDNIEMGNKIYTISNPKGYKNIITEGIIGSLQKVNDINMIQFTAPISTGSSGGMLINSKGNLIGIVTSYHDNSQNLNFALPLNSLYDIIKTYVKGYKKNIK